MQSLLIELFEINFEMGLRFNINQGNINSGDCCDLRLGMPDEMLS